MHHLLLFVAILLSCIMVLQIEWNDYAHAPVHQEVGYHEDVLDYMWNKYSII